MLGAEYGVSAVTTYVPDEREVLEIEDCEEQRERSP